MAAVDKKRGRDPGSIRQTFDRYGVKSFHRSRKFGVPSTIEAIHGVACSMISGADGALRQLAKPFFWSEWQDSNLRPRRPERQARRLSY
jgi:hypothetical protein